MPYFQYKSITIDGIKKDGTKEASSYEDLKCILKDKGEYLLEANIAKEKRRSNFLTSTNRVSPRAVANFCRQFSILLDAGVSVADSLDVLRKQNFSTYFKNVISDIYDSVLKGMFISDAMRKYPKIFKSFVVNMVHIGELSGDLTKVLIKVADYLENDQKIKSKTKSAMVYPLFLLVVVTIVTVVLMVFVVPQFEKIILENGGKVPGITRVVLSISHFFTEYWFILIPAIIVVIMLLVFFFTRTQKGKYCRNFLAIHLPILKTVTIETITTRFTTAFSILIDSGMPVIDSMEALISILDNKFFESKFVYAIEDIRRGKRIAPSIEKCDIFPKMLIEMLDVGEESSRLSEVCDTVSKYYSAQLANSIQKLSSILEPVVIIIMGVLVGTIILAVFLPIMEMTNSMGNLDSDIPDLDV